MDYVCAPARQAVSIPILNSGNHTPETAVRLIESGDANFVMFGRPLIADPDLPNKLLAGVREDVRPCIRCNEECIGRIAGRLTKLGCAVNIQACNEVRNRIEQAEQPREVVIVGAGPAGLEAARVAALEGHHVTIFEEKPYIGGQLASAATPSFKYKLRELISWYDTQLKKLGVDLRLQTRVTADHPILQTCDHILVAVGGEPVVPNIPGIRGEHVVGAIDAHLERDRVQGENIVITGGGLTGCDLALELAMEGRNVTIIEKQEKLAPDVFFINAASLYPMLEKYGVKQMVSTEVLSFEVDGVCVRNADGAEVFVPADTMINAFGMKPSRDAADPITNAYHTKTRKIGDCVGIGKVGNAVRAGYYAAQAINTLPIVKKEVPSA